MFCKRFLKVFDKNMPKVSAYTQILIKNILNVSAYMKVLRKSKRFQEYFARKCKRFHKIFS